jgi:hypothetical protein
MLKMFEDVADSTLAVMEPLLAPGALALSAMLAFLALQRVVDGARFRRRRQLAARFRTLVDAHLHADGPDGSMRVFVSAPARHRGIITSMRRAPLARSTGSAVDRPQDGAGAVSRHQEGRQDRDRTHKEGHREGA